MSIPKFDQNKPASETAIGNQKRLAQDGHLFSYAEYNRTNKRFEPEPHYIPPGTMTQDDLRGKLDELMFLNTKVIKACQELTGNVTNNLDKFIGKEEDAWAVERAKLEIQIEKLTIQKEELEAQLHEAQVQCVKFEEEGKMLGAELKVFKDKIESFKSEPQEAEEKRKPGRQPKHT